MGDLELLIRGLLVGLIIAAPVGPVNIICVQRTIVKGWRFGLLSGLGSAVADTFYGAIAGFSIGFIIQFLLREQSRIRLFGGMILIAIGVWYYCKRPRTMEEQRHEEHGHSDFFETFFLTLTNPTTVLPFLAVLAVLGLGSHRPWWTTLLVILGIFTGSMLWWLILTGMVNLFRDRFNDRAVMWMNRAAGLAIGIFGLITMVLSRTHNR